MTATTILPFITPETCVGDIVAASPSLARLFEELRIDYCCGGKQTLASACVARGLSVPMVVERIGEAAAALAAGPAEVDAAGMALSELADHIEQTHHAYLKDELPRLVEMADRVAYKHGGRDPRLREVAVVVHDLAQEMFSHMQKEEIVLFPLVRQIEAGILGGFHRLIADPIRQMEAEHDDAGRAIARLRELTDGLVPDAQACNTHRALLDGLARLEADLHRHIHKENNILFPRALGRVEAAS
jgi:regulator of cell morphogenesis and NO signaling